MLMSMFCLQLMWSGEFVPAELCERTNFKENGWTKLWNGPLWTKTTKSSTCSHWVTNSYHRWDEIVDTAITLISYYVYYVLEVVGSSSPQRLHLPTPPDPNFSQTCPTQLLVHHLLHPHHPHSSPLPARCDHSSDSSDSESNRHSYD